MRKLSLLLLAARLACADFSYEQRSQVTGGAMAAMMKLAGAFSKKLREPMSTWTYVKGNKIAHVTGTSAQIFDIDAETITHIDHEKKTYSVLTFAQMKEALDKMSAEMQGKADVDAQVQVDARETGRTKQLAGQDAKEWLLSMVYVMKDKKGNQQGEMETQSSSWLAANVEGWQELSAAQQRLGEKMARNLQGSPFGAGAPGVQPGMNESWAAMAAKMAKMNGVPMMQIVRMGPKGQLPPASTMGEPKPAAASTSPEPAVEKPKAGDIIGGALGGRFGGLGRRKAKESEREQMPQKTDDRGASAEGGMLMEMTIETLQVSTAAVDAGKLAAPAGYQQVENEMVKALNKRR